MPLNCMVASWDLQGKKYFQISLTKSQHIRTLFGHNFTTVNIAWYFMASQEMPGTELRSNQRLGGWQQTMQLWAWQTALEKACWITTQLTPLWSPHTCFHLIYPAEKKTKQQSITQCVHPTCSFMFVLFIHNVFTHSCPHTSKIHALTCSYMHSFCTTKLLLRSCKTQSTSVIAHHPPVAHAKMSPACRWGLATAPTWQEQATANDTSRQGYSWRNLAQRATSGHPVHDWDSPFTTFIYPAFQNKRA